LSVVEDSLSFSPSALEGAIHPHITAGELIISSGTGNNGVNVSGDVLWSAEVTVWNYLGSVGVEAVHSAFTLRGVSWAFIPASVVGQVHDSWIWMAEFLGKESSLVEWNLWSR